VAKLLIKSQKVKVGAKLGRTSSVTTTRSWGTVHSMPPLEENVGGNFVKFHFYR